MDREFKLRAPQKFIGPIVGVATLASAFVVACGGGKGESNPKTTPGGEVGGVTAINPSVEAVSPTIVVPEVTATVDILPSIPEIQQAVEAGFNGIVLTPDQIPDDNVRSLSLVLGFLSNCNDERNPIVFPQRIFNPEEKAYGKAKMGQCGKFGEATKKLYEVTKKQEFLAANTMAFELTKNVFKNLKDEYQLPDSFLAAMQNQYFTITP